MNADVARASMRMRAFVLRNVLPPDAVDAYKQPLPPDYELQLREPCFVWVTSRIVALDTTRTARVEETSVIFPLTTSVEEDDRVEKITDRREQTLFDGPFAVRSMMPKVGHYEARLERVGS